MAKVVPTEGVEIPSSQGVEIQPSSDGVDPAERQATLSATAGASADEEGQSLGSAVFDAAEPESEVALSPPRSTDPSTKPPESEETHDEVPQQLESGALASVDAGSVAPTLDMGKHSGMTTFSLMQHDAESSPARPDAGLSTRIEQEGEEENTTETLAERVQQAEDFEEEDSELAPRMARQTTGAGRKLARQNTGIGGGALTGGKKKKAPFCVPQTMYMGHPVGSPAAEFLERQQHRLVDVKTRRQEVAGLLELVMEHNPKNTESAMPDIDKVFPDKRGRENSQGDWCV